MALLELQNITAGYDKNVILKDLNFQVEKGELVSLLGSSGCGKTTTLRLIAGFSTPMEGKFIFDDKDYTQVPLNKRNFGFVFQSYALFPHMTVFDNVAFGLKMRNLPQEQIRKEVLEMLETCLLYTSLPRMRKPTARLNRWLSGWTRIGKTGKRPQGDWRKSAWKLPP